MMKTSLGHIRGSPVLAAIVASGMTDTHQAPKGADGHDAAQLPLEIDII